MPKEPKKTPRKVAARKPVERKPAAAKPRTRATSKVTQQMIACRAYELCERGADGDMLAHCLQAEHELTGV